MSARGVLRIIDGGRLGFWCPGCHEIHVVGPSWTFDGNFDAPTFSPSILVTSGHYMEGWPGKDKDGNPRPRVCWCTYNADSARNRSSRFFCIRCHSFVKAGKIEFLADCTHALKGQTIPLKVFDP